MNKYFQKNQAITYNLLTIMVVGILAVSTNSFYSQESSLNTLGLLVILFTFFSLIRFKTEYIFVETKALLDQPKRQLIYELSAYVLIGIALFVVEVFINNQTYLIASKLLSAILILGYFASIDSALKREHECFLKLKRKQSNIQNTIPVSRRISLFLSVTLFVVILANALSAYSYMSINTLSQGTNNTSGKDLYEMLKNAYLIETLFTLGIVVSLSLRLIHSYSLNLQYLFDIQVDALQNIQDGKLDNYIPVLSRDEFGVIAQNTNRVIDELREKEKIRQTLESIVSPDIMQKLIRSDSSILKQGEKKHIAVFFCDLRKFTSYAEKNTPEDVIFFLNTYFSKVVDIVTEHNGIVNKFMGDAILAIFPLDEDSASIDDAIDTAWDIVKHSQAIRLPDGDRFNVGIGIHMGYATAGTIGSQARFEYTFIGDTVNIASRLDGLSKRLGYSIIISEDTYKHLNEHSKARFIDLGAQQIRGKKQPLHVFGASTVQHIEN
jgi:class 3 adenylate cyclase